MNSPAPNARQYLDLLSAYRLADRDPKFAQHAMLVASGRLSEGMVRGLLWEAQEFIEHLTDHPCYLHRPPSTAEELYANGRADVEFFTLIESEEGLRYGLRLLDRPRHFLVAGATGSGKTTAIRAIIMSVHALNQHREAQES